MGRRKEEERVERRGMVIIPRRLGGQEVEKRAKRRRDVERWAPLGVFWLGDKGEKEAV